MSDNTQDLRIHIISDADNRGFAQTSQAAKTLKADTSDLSDETKRALGIIPDLENSIAKQGEAAAESGLSTRELRKALGDIGNIAAPGAGRALGELALGPFGAVLAVAAAAEMLNKSLESASEAADKLADELAKPETGGIEAVRSAWDDAAKAYGDYLDKLAVAGRDKDPIKTEVDRAKELVIARLEGQKKIAEALGDTAGVAYAQLSIDRTKGSSSLMTELGMHEQAQASLEAEASAKAFAAASAQKKFLDDQAKLAADRAFTTPNSPENKAILKRIEDAESAVELARAEPDFSPQGRDLRADKAERIAAAQAEANAVNQELGNRVKEQRRLEETLDQRTTARDAALAGAKAAAEAAINNNARLSQLPGEIGQAYTVENVNEHSERVVEILNAHGSRTGETFANLEKALGFSATAIATSAERIVSGQENLAARMAQLEARVAALPQQMH